MSISIAQTHQPNYQTVQATNSTNATTSVATATPSTDTTTAIVSSTTTDTFTIPTKWGFKVDANGFFGTDFNTAAGLPENMKIHESMMSMASDYSKVSDENIDPMTVVSKVWNLYKTVAGNTLDPDKTGYMTQEEVGKMPKSYVSKGSLLDGVVSVQTDDKEYFDKLSANMTFIGAAAVKPSIGLRGFSNLAIAPNDDPTTSFYGARDVYDSYATTYEKSQPTDKLAVGELFGAFFYKQVSDEIGDFKGGDATVRGDTVQSTRDYYARLQSGQDTKTYISNTKGEDYLANLTKQLATKPDGTFDPSLVDSFFEKMDQSAKEELADYQANNYPSLDSSLTSKSSDNSPLSKISKAYQTSGGNTAKLPSGSLMNSSA